MLFVTAVVVLVYFLVFSSGKKTLDQLKLDSQVIPLKIMASKSDTTNNLAFIIDGKVDKSRMKSFASIEYEDLKSEFGVVSDFCIFFEDKDGKLINLTSDLDEENNVIGIGNKNFKVSGYDCGISS